VSSRWERRNEQRRLEEEYNRRNEQRRFEQEWAEVKNALRRQLAEQEDRTAFEHRIIQKHRRELEKLEAQRLEDRNQFDAIVAQLVRNAEHMGIKDPRGLDEPGEQANDKGVLPKVKRYAGKFFK
jgi:hypothetical protein